MYVLLFFRSSDMYNIVKHWKCNKDRSNSLGAMVWWNNFLWTSLAWNLQNVKGILKICSSFISATAFGVLSYLYMHIFMPFQFNGYNKNTAWTWPYDNSFRQQIMWPYDNPSRQQIMWPYDNPSFQKVPRDRWFKQWTLIKWHAHFKQH